MLAAGNTTMTETGQTARITVSEWLLRLEPLVLLVIGYAFWFPDPPRGQWMWLLLLLLPVFGARLIHLRRLWTRTPLDGWLLGFVALAILNIAIANSQVNSPPYTRGIIMLSRPLFGLALYAAFGEYA